jgi:hypothetical protein
MSRKLTRILLPGQRGYGGLMDWGELTAEEMIRQFRAHAANLRKQAEAIEAASDDDFRVDVVRGAHKEELIRNLQPGREP